MLLPPELGGKDLNFWLSGSHQRSCLPEDEEVLHFYIWELDTKEFLRSLVGNNGDPYCLWEKDTTSVVVNQQASHLDDNERLHCSTTTTRKSITTLLFVTNYRCDSRFLALRTTKTNVISVVDGGSTFSVIVWRGLQLENGTDSGEYCRQNMIHHSQWSFPTPSLGLSFFVILLFLFLAINSPRPTIHAHFFISGFFNLLDFSFLITEALSVPICLMQLPELFTST